MVLLTRFFSPEDIFIFPVCVLIFFFILRSRANRVTNPVIRGFYYKAFYFKLICVISFAVITELYFKGGDTGLYYQAVKDLRTAVKDNPDLFWKVFTTKSLNQESPFLSYFYYDNYADDFTYGYMFSAHNFFPPKLALIPSYLFFNSYISICMCFGFFALGGAIRLFKAFYHYYPHLYKELAFACLFLPGVGFWSSGLLKDPVSFGCIGIILYAFINMFIRKKHYFSSIVWVTICCYFLLNIKTYILLVLVLSILIWQFAEFNKLIKDRTLRTVFTVLTFVSGAVVGFFMLRSLTSLEAAQEFKLDNFLENVQKERQVYANINQVLTGDSHFKINDSNPVALFFGSITATFYRPYFWEINTPIALLSAFESMIFLFATLYLLYKRGIKKFFATSFSDGRILMCFVFAFVFAFAVGSSTANFGALSRYKIPCTPFYMILLILLYDKLKLEKPKWFRQIIQIIFPEKKKYVRHSRVY